MKEWIYKDGSGEYVLTTDSDVANLAADAVEVPDGAHKYVYFKEYDNANFYKCDFDAVWQDDGYWDHDMDGYKSYCKGFGIVLWQRQPNQTTIDAMNDYKTEAFDTKEMVNHPEHYNKHPSGIECIDIARHHDFAIGSAIKYLWRAGLKDSDNEVQDLKKAVWYIQDKIKQLESKNVDDKTIDWIDEDNK